MDALIFETLSIDQLDTDSDWWRIYDDTFPSTEREPRDVIRKSLRMGIGIAIRGQRSGRTIAIATLHLLRDPPVAFLVYLALDEHARGRGDGGRLFEFAFGVARDATQSGEIRGMVWEVEIPQRAASNVEREQRERRIRFFERHGGQLLTGPYLQPPVDRIAPVPMRLMYRPSDDARIDAPATASLIRAIYFEKYGNVNGIAHDVLGELLT